MTSDRAAHEGGTLHAIEIGDEIVVSGRETPMEVVEKEETPSGRGINLIAENRYGEYHLTEYEDESILLRVGGGKQLEGTVEVKRTNAQ